MKKLLSILMMMLLLSSVAYGKMKVNVPETVRIKLNNGEIIEIELDEYLYGVVSSEMGTSYRENGKTKEVGIEALKAQAIASRSYAVYNIQHAKYDGYDMTTTTSDQVYKAGNVKDIVKEAVDATSGQVMTYDGAVISAYFFSTSGGHTESSENVWPSALPYCRGVEDPYEPYIDNKSEWEVRIPYSQYGELKILERSENDRVTKMKIGNTIYTNSGIRSKLGNTFVKSTWFELDYDKKTEEYILTGKGYGHGVGMSQYGAMGMAAKGFDYEEILTWYYTDVEIVPDGSQNIVIEEEEKTVKEETKTETEETKSTIEIVEEKKRGPLLEKIISTIESWR